ncbi:DUF1343 domain-containing protein [Azotosporobacter soli]|uniref:exo-beta-N-acetylmuramidase NamZ family protein n=1 Tax=Azotosporobacter soli TaxID=3055040 RepID=UPI0031FEAB27
MDKRNGCLLALLLGSLAFFTAGAEAAKLPPKAAPPLVQVTAAPEKTVVRLGIDNLDQYLPLFAGKRVGLITNATGMTSDYKSSVEVLAAKTNLTTLYSPEHGLWGDRPAGEAVGSYTDLRSGLPVYSLYGDTKKPSAAMLADIDVLAFDIQDVGSRSYTYIYTMAYAMESCREQGKTFVVFDRPNPAGGMVEGPVLKPGFTSFIGMYPIPIRHGMTVGELARLFNESFGIHCKLEVVPMTGWRRSMLFADTGLPWIMTSPNIPTPDSALVYSGTGLFGGTNVSEGVGTTRPFELVGAPWLRADSLADDMNAKKLPGVHFRAAYFVPRFGLYQGEVCGGVQIHVTDAKKYRALETALTLLYQIKESGGVDFRYNRGYGEGMIDLISGEDRLRSGRYSLEEIKTFWKREAEQFQKQAEIFYLYKP